MHRGRLLAMSGHSRMLSGATDGIVGEGERLDHAGEPGTQRRRAASVDQAWGGTGLTAESNQSKFQMRPTCSGVLKSTFMM